jgi:transposase
LARINKIYYFSSFILNFFKMTKGKAIPLKMKAKMRERRREGASAAKIAIEFGVSVRSVHRAISEPLKKQRKRGRPSLMSGHERKVFAMKARESPTKSAKEIANAAGVSISAHTAQRELRRNSFRYLRQRLVQSLKEKNREKRVQFAEKHVAWPQDKWDRVVFSDEKKWNLTGPDNYVSLWQENQRTYRIEAEKKLRRGIMVWGAIAPTGGIVIVRITGKLNSSRYCEMLENGLLNESERILPRNFILQQDNAPVHVSRETKTMLSAKKVSVLEWPAYSPDLNPIENVWSIVSREVYKDQQI